MKGNHEEEKIERKTGSYEAAKRESYKGASILKNLSVSGFKTSLSKLINRSLVKSLNAQKENKIIEEQKKNRTPEIAVKKGGSTNSADLETLKNIGKALAKSKLNLAEVARSKSNVRNSKNASLDLEKKKKKTNKNTKNLKQLKKIGSVVSVFKILYGDKIAAFVGSELMKAFNAMKDPKLSKEDRSKCRKLLKSLFKTLAQAMKESAKKQYSPMAEKPSLSSEIFKPSATPYSQNNNKAIYK